MDDERDLGQPSVSAAAADAAEARFQRVQASLLERWPEDRIAPTLDRVRSAVNLLGDPQAAIPAVHIAGTNGKTSTARMIDSLLGAFGLTTGRFTSPHLTSVRERIVLAGEPISADRFVEVWDDITAYIEMVDAQSITSGGPAMSTFEVLTVAAFAAFADAPVDVNVIEVGMGGRWDATNVVDGAVQVITPIGLDHQEYLGSTLPEIAGEKAGIITDGAPVVVAGQRPGAAEVVLQRIAERGAEPLLEGLAFRVAERRIAVGGQLLTIEGLGGRYEDPLLPLHGAHQAQNAAIALTAVEAFLGGGERRLDVDVIREGFAAVQSPGRMEVVRRSPTVIVDAAHNPDGLAVALAALAESFAPDRVVAVFGVLDNKDAAAMIDLLATAVDQLVVTRPGSPRGMDAQDLGELAAGILGDDRVRVEPALPDAVAAAVERADDPELTPGTVLIVGSVVLAGQARALLGAE